MQDQNEKDFIEPAVLVRTPFRILPELARAHVYQSHVDIEVFSRDGASSSHESNRDKRRYAEVLIELSARREADIPRISNACGKPQEGLLAAAAPVPQVVQGVWCAHPDHAAAWA